jgi:hypothetical protein
MVRRAPPARHKPLEAEPIDPERDRTVEQGLELVRVGA